MQIEWDEEKDAQNRAKHGVGLGDAVRLEWGKAFEQRDSRFEYGEIRVKTLAPLNGRIFVCICTLRDGLRRIISLRKANPREVGVYDASRR
jgi:uncharacterized protein